MGAAIHSSRLSDARQIPMADEVSEAPRDAFCRADLHSHGAVRYSANYFWRIEEIARNP
jgi:hypothetical protein